MFKIHKTHSKLELCQLIDTYFKINFHNPRKYTKAQIKKVLEEHLLTIDELDLPVNNELYHFTNIIDLKFFLVSINPKKLLTVKQKQQIQMTCKKLKHFCNNYYNLKATDYKSIESVYYDGKFVEPYGDIPSVRKVCKLLNNNINKPCILKPVISPMVQKELDKKLKYKQTKILKCVIKQGNFLIKFD